MDVYEIQRHRRQNGIRGKPTFLEGFLSLFDINDFEDKIWQMNRCT